MELSPVVARLQRELLAVADAGGAEARAVAERLVAPLESAVRLVIIEVLAEALDAVTREIAPGSAHLRLRGRDPDVVVIAPPARAASVEGRAPDQDRDGRDGRDEDDLGDGPISRINFRPPESLKARIEQAAARERLSVNAWLVRATSAALDPRPGRPSTSTRNHFSGWVG
jgi:hypothetical protein